jgi:predicted RNase H-like HicB family nuclease
MSRKYAVIYEEGPNGVGAHVPDLPGCVAVGDTLEDTERLIREAIEMHIAGIIEDGRPVPNPTTRCEYVEARVPA